jgi:hypothetical protein
MRLTLQILICLIILAAAVATILAPVLIEGVGILVLTGVCAVVAWKQGLRRAAILFLKEMW